MRAFDPHMLMLVLLLLLLLLLVLVLVLLLQGSLAVSGIEVPSPIQEAAIPALLGGANAAVQSYTGSGKVRVRLGVLALAAHHAGSDCCCSCCSARQQQRHWSSTASTLLLLQPCCCRTTSAPVTVHTLPLGRRHCTARRLHTCCQR